jgi:CheY-like chemotaxis protein
MIRDRCILVAEDDENDVAFLRRAFAQAEVAVPFQIVSDGQAAIDYLSGAGQYSDRSQHPLPGVLLLDLKMPRKSGLEVLQWVKSQSTLRALPVIMLTSSVDPSEMSTAYRIGTSAFVTKPSGTSERLELAKAIKGFWLRFNQLP